jgi:HK97 family phage major capsid protein
MTEFGPPSEGGFLVPTEYSVQIHNVSLENELVMPLATVIPMKSNELRLPAVEIGDHSSNLFGGFTASYIAETGTITPAEPKTRQMTLIAKKLVGMLKFSNELMSDIPGGEKEIIKICGEGLAWFRDKFFLKGSGAGEPLGVLNSPCLLVQSKETEQPADTIRYENLTGMLGKLHPASFKKSVWVFHQTAIPQLLQLSLAVGTGGSHVAVMKENNGKFSILTRPVIFTEKTEVLGDQGDALLADFSQFVVGLNSEMRIDISGHIYFTTDESAARLIERHDAQSLWDSALTLADGVTETSPFVVLAERA